MECVRDETKGLKMSSENRYSVERVKDRLWVVVDRARNGAPIGRSADEAGARRIASLLARLRSVTGRGDVMAGAPSPQAA